MNSIIRLRKFPYPYRAVLAICSDLDNTPSLDIYLQMMDYLNGNSDTPWGKGLGLEIGNSFWFFNKTSSFQMSYFRNSTREETPFASVCRDFWISGHVDVMHTYGDFDEGGFSRKYAELALEELYAHGASILVWVNHGNENNTQNVGLFEYHHGSNPDKVVSIILCKNEKD